MTQIKRTEKVNFWLSPEEKTKIDKLSTAHKLTTSEYLRQAALHKLKKPVDFDEAVRQAILKQTPVDSIFAHQLQMQPHYALEYGTERYYYFPDFNAIFTNQLNPLKWYPLVENSEIGENAFISLIKICIAPRFKEGLVINYKQVLQLREYIPLECGYFEEKNQNWSYEYSRDLNISFIITERDNKISWQVRHGRQVSDRIVQMQEKLRQLYAVPE